MRGLIKCYSRSAIFTAVMARCIIHLFSARI